jgi:hypothetical protein
MMIASSIEVKKSPFLELAHLLVRLDHVASRIVNAHHCIM